MNGIYRLSADGELVRLADQTGPNGIAFSPDESTLYVADSATRQWMAYPVNEDGTLGEVELLLDASASEESGSADGLKIDDQGNLWATGPGASGSSRRTARISARSSRTRCRPTWPGATRIGGRST